MCGIAGKFGKYLSCEEIDSSKKYLLRRGPDNFSFIDIGKSTLIHSRLAINDLSDHANQPMFSNDMSIAIVFNGEIFNFKKLKKQHLQNYAFKTTSDTEVIIALYELFGINFVSLLDGMFAIALYDLSKDIIYLIRDRVGEKPLYYSTYNGNLVFSSDSRFVKDIIQDDLNVDEESLEFFLILGYTPPGKSIYNNVKEILPGTYLSFSENSCTTSRYWSLIDSQKNHTSGSNSEFISAFNESCILRSISDVPITSYLSSGVDSSFVLSKTPNVIKSYTLASNKFDESLTAKIISNYLNVPNLKVLVDSNLINKQEELLTEAFCEPNADSACISMLILSEQASLDNMKVAITGDGADELFSGYPQYKKAIILDFLVCIPFVSTISNYLYKVFEFNFLYVLSLKDNVARYIYIRSMNKKSLRNLDILSTYTYYVFRKYYDFAFKNGLSPLKCYTFIDYCTLLPNMYLRKADSASMYYGIELRSPFLSYKLLNGFMYRKFNTLFFLLAPAKFSLKKIAFKTLPSNLFSKKKHGFDLSLEQSEDLGAISLSTNYSNVNSSLFSNSRLLKIVKGYIYVK